MSLLMNALKKAETAKASAQGESAQQAEQAAAKRDLASELGLDPQPARARSAASEPLLPASSSTPPSSGGLALELEPDPIPRAVSASSGIASSGKDAAPRPSAPSSRTGYPDAAVQTARSVFAAKSAPASRSRTPFYSLVALCLLAAGGYAAYVWKQMQPPPPPPASASPPPSPTPVTSAAPPPGGLAPPSEPQGLATEKEGAPVMVAPSAQQLPAVSAPVARSRPEPTQTDDDALPVGRTGGETLPARRDAARAAGGAPVDSPTNLRISRANSAPSVNPDVAAGYAALQGGDLDGAAQAYEKALRSDQSNRDALLGMATIQLRLNRMEAAESLFRRVLRLHPQDSYAAAQLAALQAGADPLGALSQVNSLIAREADRAEPANGALPFIQGNQLAAQGRWNEAQQAYFNAHRADPGNPDFCYNLAVALDRIHEPRLARDFYAKALELSRIRAAGFDVGRAQARLSQLAASPR